MVIKSGHVIAWKATMTVKVAGLKRCMQELMRNNKSNLPAYFTIANQKLTINLYIVLLIKNGE